MSKKIVRRRRIDPLEEAHGYEHLIPFGSLLELRKLSEPDLSKAASALEEENRKIEDELKSRRFISFSEFSALEKRVTALEGFLPKKIDPGEL